MRKTLDDDLGPYDLEPERIPTGDGDLASKIAFMMCARVAGIPSKFDFWVRFLLV